MSTMLSHLSCFGICSHGGDSFPTLFFSSHQRQLNNHQPSHVYSMKEGGRHGFYSGWIARLSDEFVPPSPSIPHHWVLQVGVKNFMPPFVSKVLKDFSLLAILLPNSANTGDHKQNWAIYISCDLGSLGTQCDPNYNLTAGFLPECILYKANSFKTSVRSYHISVLNWSKVPSSLRLKCKLLVMAYSFPYSLAANTCLISSLSPLTRSTPAILASLLLLQTEMILPQGFPFTLSSAWNALQPSIRIVPLLSASIPSRYYQWDHPWLP